MLQVTCTNEQQVIVNLAPRTAPSPGHPQGRPAAIDGAPVVTVISGDGTFLQDPAAPMSFKVVSGEVLGDTVYDVAGDADLGAGVVTIHDTVTLTVTSAVAANFGLSAGATEPKA